jgi:WD repeat-containing protein 19
MWPNHLGNKAVCLDKNGRAFILNFVWETEIDIEGYIPAINKIIWDQSDPNIFLGCTVDTAYTFLHNKHFYTGDKCSVVYELLALSDMEKLSDPSFTTFEGLEPIFFENGSITLLNKANSVQIEWLGSHNSFPNFTGDANNTDVNLRYFFQNLMLGKFENALSACDVIPEEEKELGFEVLASLSLKNMNMLMAKKAYQLAGNISMVYTLEGLLAIEEKKILQGFIAMILCDYQLAQEYFFSSSKPEYGLDLRCDTKEWGIALNLAENMAPERVPLIKRRLAEEQEKQGNYPQALKSFQASVVETSKLSSQEKEKFVQHNFNCEAGIARNSIRTGNIQKGFEIAQDLKDKEVGCI